MAYAQLISPVPDRSWVHGLSLFQGQGQPVEVSVFHPGCYVLLAKDKKPYAVLDTSTAKVLEELDCQGFSYQAYLAADCDRGDGKKISETCGDREDDISFAIDLNICGLRSRKRELGKLLSKIKVCLQQPLYLDVTFEYDNPHYFTRAGQRTPWVEVETGDRKSGKPEEPSIKQLLSDIIENQLSHANELRELESDAKIKTRLLR